jgi:hypothetical protein
VGRHILRTPSYRTAGQLRLALRQIRRRRADSAIDRISGTDSGETGNDIRQQHCVGGETAVHFPITDNEFATHSSLNLGKAPF